WGGPRKEYAAIKFFLYTLAGSVFMLLAFIALYYNADPTYLSDGTSVTHNFSIPDIGRVDYAGKNLMILGLSLVKVCWVALFVGFAIKIPMFPFHTWFPDAHVEAPTAISVILAGVLLKMGTYGILRINFGILPEATAWAAPAVASGRMPKLMRRMPYVPILRSTPARMTLIAVGASTCASGSHVWNGNIGILMANPTKSATQHTLT